MERNELEKLLSTPAYGFLKTNPHLGSKLMLLTLGGSHAYGTNIETSDVDVRGIAANSISDIIGMSSFEQVEDRNTDTVIYSLKKIFCLLADCNPNTIEILGCKPEHYVYLDDRGQLLLANKELFLSRKAVYSFGGYARTQLKRLENILARGRSTGNEKEEHIRKSVQMTLEKFADSYEHMPEGNFHLYVGPGKTKGMESEILCDMDVKGFPLRGFKTMLQDMGQIVAQYSTLGKRNDKKDDMHLDKHAMHLVRLYLTGLDILEKSEINTYRAEDHDFLMDIRNGKFRLPNGSYDPAFFDYMGELDKRLKYAAENSALPSKPDFKKLEELLMTLNKMTLEKEGWQS